MEGKLSGRRLRVIKPRFHMAYYLVLLSSSKEYGRRGVLYRLMQLRCGGHHLRSNSHRWAEGSSPFCSMCSCACSTRVLESGVSADARCRCRNVVETPQHFMFGCSCTQGLVLGYIEKVQAVTELPGLRAEFAEATDFT